jgi:ATP-dependent RNA helicase MSS116
MRAPKVHVGPRGGTYVLKNGIKTYVTKKKKKQSGGEIATLTEVQAMSLEPGLAGKDILAKSNTGSGKTLAFLMVAIERIRAHGGPDPTSSFPVVILTPVTDLATQIMQVAKRFLAYHGMEADVAIGGTSERQDIQRLSRRRIDVLVATPGRFKSILDQSPIVAKRLAMCQTFVIDEADKMTDPGFIGQTKYIHAKAKNIKMQTLMFSATMDKQTLIATGLLKQDATFIDASAGSKPQVNTKVKQVSIVAPIAQHLDALVQVVKMKMAERTATVAQAGGAYNVANYRLTEQTRKALREWEMPSMKGYRIMIFLSSNAYIDYVANVFTAIMPNVTTFVLHGNLQQNKRTKMSDSFRTTDNCVLFTSDASARGVDYPDVSCVIQMGFDSRSEYLQRVGRTGRAGKAGTTYMITCPEENSGVESVCDVLSEVHVGECSPPKCGGAKIDAKRYQFTNVEYPKDGKNASAAKKAFGGWLGSLASKWKRMKMSPQAVVDMAQAQAKAFGLEPYPKEKLCDKLHLKAPPC